MQAQGRPTSLPSRPAEARHPARPASSIYSTQTAPPEAPETSEPLPPFQDPENTFEMTHRPGGGQRYPQRYMPRNPPLPMEEESTANPYEALAQNPFHSNQSLAPPSESQGASSVTGTSTTASDHPIPPNPHDGNTTWKRLTGRGANPLPTPPPQEKTDADQRSERQHRDNHEEKKRSNVGAYAVGAATIAATGAYRTIPRNQTYWGAAPPDTTTHTVTVTHPPHTHRWTYTAAI